MFHKHILFILESLLTHKHSFHNFYALASKDRGHNVLPLSICMTVCSSIRLSIFQLKLNVRLNIFLLLLYLFSYKVHIWYQGTSHRYTSVVTKVKVICQGQGQILWSHFPKQWLFSGALVFHKQSLLTLSQTSPVFSRLQCRSFENTVGKEKLLVTSNFSFSRSVFYLFGELSVLFIKFEIVVCKLFQFGRV